MLVYQWVEWLREYVKTKEDLDLGEGLEPADSLRKSNGGARSGDSSSPVKSAESAVLGASQGGTDGDSGMEIVHGEPLTDRKSTFQAHVAEVHSADEVKS